MTLPGWYDILNTAMAKRATTLAAFLFLTPLTIFLSVRLLLHSTKQNLPTDQAILGESTTTQNEPAAGPLISNSSPQIQSVSGEPLLADARPIIIKNYLDRWRSPMAQYSELIVRTSDFYGVSPLLVVAIAQQESNLGTKGVANCYNAWGWAQTSVYTRCFDSWEHGIKNYIKEFSENYIKIGLTTPEEIMSKYNAASPGGSWAKGVTQFLDDLSSPAS